MLPMLSIALAWGLGNAALAEIPNFENEGKGWANYPEPNKRFVVLNQGLASITASRFVLPKNSMSYPVAGITIFPYYQASPELKEFLNNTRINGIPITSYGASPVTPRPVLPGTDTVRFNITLPPARLENQKATGLAYKKQFDETSWLVAHQTGQCFIMPGDSSSLVILSNGSMFNACAERTLALKCGTMWVLTGDRPAAVLTKYGAVGIRPHSIAAVEQTWFNRLRASSLYGHPLELQFAYKGNQSKLPLERGKEVTISESAIASSGSSDYVEPPKSDQSKLAVGPSHLPQLPAGLSINSVKIDPHSSNFVTELAGLNPPTSADMRIAFNKMFRELGISKTQRDDAARKLKTRKDAALAEDIKSEAFRNSVDGRYFVPGARRVVAVRSAKQFPEVSEQLKSLWVQQGLVKYLSDAKVEVEDFGRLAISSGEAVFEAKEAMSVRLNDCFVKVAPGAIVQVKVSKSAIVLRNLKEFKQKSVLLKCKGRSIECPSGAELIVGKTTPDLFSEMKLDGVSRRNVNSIETAEGSVVINKSEFDLTSLMQYSPIMWRLYESKNEHDQKLVAQVVKMDAVLSVVTAGRGSYHRMSGLPNTH